jgi:lysophospholipase L1-like esterase
VHNPSWRRYVALGDSFTEGLSDPDPARPGEYRGWADRLAEHLAAASPDADVEYANLAIRGRLVAQVLDGQLPVALAAQPDLVSLVAGGNDLLRPGGDPDALAARIEEAVVRLRAAGADVLLATGVDVRQTPIIKRIAAASPSSTRTSGRSRPGTVPSSSTSGAPPGCRTGGCGTPTAST